MRKVITIAVALAAAVMVGCQGPNSLITVNVYRGDKPSDDTKQVADDQPMTDEQIRNEAIDAVIDSAH